MQEILHWEGYTEKNLRGIFTQGLLAKVVKEERIVDESAFLHNEELEEW